MRVRQETRDFLYPREVVSTMKPQIIGALLALKHHFRNRRLYGTAPARSWAKELKRIDANSGYSTALQQIVG